MAPGSPSQQVPVAGRSWRVLVPVTALFAGLLFATSAATAAGTDLRGGRRTQLTELIAAERHTVDTEESRAAQLRSAVAQVQALAAAGNTRVAAERAKADELNFAAGLMAVTGRGVTVALDDAPRRAGMPPASNNPDDLVVHQQDVQAVVNALWAGGADAMTLMGQRVISTSAVRCVGNTLVLHGRVYSPPFVVSATGDPERLRIALDQEPGVELFRSYVDRYDLGWSVRTTDLKLPAYDGPLELPHVARAR